MALAPKDEAKREKLLKRLGVLTEAAEEAPDDEALAAEYEQVSEAIDVIEAKSRAYRKEEIGRAGAVVLLTHDGALRIERGLVRKEQAGEPQGKTRPAARQCGLGDTLTRELAAVRTGMIAAVLAGKPDLAFVAVAHALALSTFYGEWAAESTSALRIVAKDTRAAKRVRDPKCCRAFDALAEQRAAWEEGLPGYPVDLWDWCLGQSQETLMHLVAICAATTVDATFEQHRVSPGERHQSADRLADALGVRASDWCSLSSLKLFERTPKAFIVDVIRREINPDRAGSYAKMKKTQVVERATAALDGQWLPEPLLRSAPAVEEVVVEGTDSIDPSDTEVEDESLETV